VLRDICKDKQPFDNKFQSSLLQPVANAHTEVLIYAGSRQGTDDIVNCKGVGSGDQVANMQQQSVGLLSELGRERYTCDDVSASGSKEDFLDGARVTPEHHAVEATCLLQRSCFGHQRFCDVAACTHLLLLLCQPSLDGIRGHVNLRQKRKGQVHIICGPGTECW